MQGPVLPITSSGCNSTRSKSQSRTKRRKGDRHRPPVIARYSYLTGGSARPVVSIPETSQLERQWGCERRENAFLERRRGGETAKARLMLWCWLKRRQNTKQEAGDASHYEAGLRLLTQLPFLVFPDVVTRTSTDYDLRLSRPARPVGTERPCTRGVRAHTTMGNVEPLGL